MDASIHPAPCRFPDRACACLPEKAALMASTQVGDFITFAEEVRRYEVMARSERYLVCTKPFAARRTVVYTIIDLLERVRGTENLVFGAGAETKEQCEEMLARLEGRCPDTGFTTEVSHRNRVPLRVTKVFAPRAEAAWARVAPTSPFPDGA